MKSKAGYFGNVGKEFRSERLVGREKKGWLERI